MNCVTIVPCDTAVLIMTWFCLLRFDELVIADKGRNLIFQKNNSFNTKILNYSQDFVKTNKSNFNVLIQDNKVIGLQHRNISHLTSGLGWDRAQADQLENLRYKTAKTDLTFNDNSLLNSSETWKMSIWNIDTSILANIDWILQEIQYEREAKPWIDRRYSIKTTRTLNLSLTEDFSQDLSHTVLE